jgi:hypothetical protein
MTDKKICVGSRVPLSYEGRDFEAIVIDPNGLGKGQPSVGFGFRMAERNVGIPNDTLSRWVLESDDVKYLELPSGKRFRVLDIQGDDNNSYRVVEASEWFSIAVNVLINPGKTGKGLRGKLGDFVTWFAVKGFYAESYVALKGVYTEKDSRATTQWLEARQLGVPIRKIYTDLLQSEGCQAFEYANWTNHIYQGLFEMPAKEMKEFWELMDGRSKVARNYIPKSEGLDAVRYCEDMVVRMFIDDLQEAHDDAIKLTKRKYLDRS